MNTNDKKLTTNNKTIIYTMRFKPSLHAVLKKMAEDDKRSVAKEIEFLLEKITAETNLKTN